MVYTKIMRGLRYMHALNFVEKDGVPINDIGPRKLALHLVVTFDNFLDEDLLTSSDKALYMNINFVKLI